MRHGVLPVPADILLHHVDRARLELQRHHVLGILFLLASLDGAETHARPAGEREADDVLEAFVVPVPAEG